MRLAIALVNAAADGAGDEDVTPSGISASISAALEAPGLRSAARARHYLVEALDAVGDGMPADHVAMMLYAALGALEAGPGG